jgi:murein DD-endopeptidase MepM/ murein hydrolase activator NlpD
VPAARSVDGALLLGSAASADDLLAKLGTMDRLVAANRGVYADAVSARNNAQSLSDKAKVARDERDRLQQEAQQKMQAAQDAATAAQAALAEQDKNLGTLQAQLAALRTRPRRRSPTTRPASKPRARPRRRARPPSPSERRKQAEAEAAANAANGGGGGGGGGGGEAAVAARRHGRVGAPGIRLHQLVVRQPRLAWPERLRQRAPRHRLRHLLLVAHLRRASSRRLGVHRRLGQLRQGRPRRRRHHRLRPHRRAAATTSATASGSTRATSSPTSATPALDGCHLHFEVYWQGVRIDPAPVLYDHGINVY